jgi:succinate-acetate transporter protein
LTRRSLRSLSTTESTLPSSVTHVNLFTDACRVQVCEVRSVLDGIDRPPLAHGAYPSPAPLGLSAFALTTFFLSLVNVSARSVFFWRRTVWVRQLTITNSHIQTQNLIVGLALAYGGLCQLLAGMWEFAAGNTFGGTSPHTLPWVLLFDAVLSATAFSSYGQLAPLLDSIHRH